MADPVEHYRRHKETYDKISAELDTIRESFLSADRFTQKAMLFDSMVFAVTSVQNDISVLRRAFRGYRKADTWGDLKDVMKSVNYGNNKFDYIRSNFDEIFGPFGDRMVESLENGNIWWVVENMAGRLGGVSYVKAPFIISMLGFKDVMCIDTNVAQMVPDDDIRSKGYKSLDEYKDAVERVESEFPELSEVMSTFMVQWIVFDANRNTGVARHEEWFEAMLPGTTFGRQTALGDY